MSNRAERRRLMRNGTTGDYTLLRGGPEVEAKQRFNAPLPPMVAGEHLWVMINCYRILHPERLETEAFHADLENLLSIDGPGCLWCEKTYAEMKGKRCPGEASNA